MLAILARRFEPALSQRPVPDRRRRVRTAAAMVAVLAIIGSLVSLPLALIAGGMLALVLRA